MPQSTTPPPIRSESLVTGADAFARLDERVVLVTGACGGVGTALVHSLLTAGARVVAADTVEAHAVRTEPDSDRLFHLDLDVRSKAGVSAAMWQAHSRWSQLDALVSNAGVMYEVAAEHEASDSAWAQTLAVNLDGAYRMTTAALPYLRMSDRAAIVSISSQLAYTGGPNLSAYAATKAGLLGLTRAFAQELAPQIRVNAVAPGPLETAMTAQYEDEAWRRRKTERLALQRFGTPAEVAPLVRFLLSDEASYITGQTMLVNGGGAMT